MRKTFLHLLFVGLFTLTLTTSCSEDDNENKPADEEFLISRSHTGVFDGELGDKGELTINCNYKNDDLSVSQFVVKYSISHLLGEIIWNSIMKWEGEGSIYTFKWAAELLDVDGIPIQHNGKKVYCSIDVGEIPDSYDGFGWNVSGSPNWEKVFKYYNEDTKELETGIGAEDAKEIYKADFVLGNIIILEINDEKI